MHDFPIEKILKTDLPNFTADFLESFPSEFSYRGNISITNTTLITIVGPRNPTSYGMSLVTHLIEELSKHPVATVSGLAYGIDAFVHTESLRCNIPTIAIPGSGLSEEIIYPRGNMAIAREILDSGGLLLSPFQDDARALKYFFSVRNGLMAAISHAVIVIEAGEKSGSLITGHRSLEYGKPTYVFPGSYFSPLSKGCHQLIQKGASVIDDVQTIIEDLNLQSTEAPESLTVDNIFNSPKSLGELCEYFKKDPADMLTKLTLLELEGKITQFGGLYYRKR